MKAWKSPGLLPAWTRSSSMSGCRIDLASRVARQLRRVGNQVPILMLTARDAVGDRVAGLDAGADDYLVKPFAYEELLARLRALGRRPPPRSTMRLSAGPIVLDEALRRVDVAGKEVQLSGREYSILECLLRRPGQVLSRDQLLDYAWPYGAALTPNTVEAYIHLLRDKLGPGRRGLHRDRPRDGIPAAWRLTRRARTATRRCSAARGSACSPGAAGSPSSSSSRWARRSTWRCPGPSTRAGRISWRPAPTRSCGFSRIRGRSPAASCLAPGSGTGRPGRSC
jgi:hypothetical protein